MPVGQWQCYVNKTGAAAPTLQIGEDDRLQTGMPTPSGAQTATNAKAEA